MTKKNDHINWVLIRDSIVLDGVFETQMEAEKEMGHNEWNYRGNWKIVPMRDNDFKKYIRGMMSIFDCMERARGIGNLAVKYL